MIKKTLFCTFLMLASYSMIIMKVNPNLQVVQHQWQDNVIRAQNLMYNENSNGFKNVIVGTSLSRRLVMDSLKGYYNLSFNGKSIFDGLYIIAHQKKLPENVFIETNFFYKKEDTSFTSSLFQPFIYNLKMYFPALRDGKQPIAILIRSVYTIVNRLIKKLKLFSGTNTVANKKTDVEQEDLFLKMLTNLLKDYSKTPKPRLLEERFDTLNRYIELLQKSGVNILFFEMPINEKLCSLPLSVAVREGFYKKFPANKYLYIPQPDCAAYQTTDGAHLTIEGATLYTSFFKEKTKKYAD